MLYQYATNATVNATVNATEKSLAFAQGFALINLYAIILLEVVAIPFD